MTSTSTLYGVDPLYSDSSDEDFGERIGRVNSKPRYYTTPERVATVSTDSIDPDSTSSDDSEDDAMLVALVSAIATKSSTRGGRASIGKFFNPLDPIALETESEEDESSERNGGSQGNSNSSDYDQEYSEYSDDSDGYSDDSVDLSKHKGTRLNTHTTRACAKSEMKNSQSPARPDLSSTRPSPGGGRWGPPPGKVKSLKSPVNTRNNPTSNMPYTVQAAVARAVAKSLEAKAGKMERSLVEDETEKTNAVDAKTVIASVDALDKQAELARRTAVRYEKEAAFERSVRSASSPEQVNASSCRRRAPTVGFGTAKRVTLFDELVGKAVGEEGVRTQPESVISRAEQVYESRMRTKKMNRTLTPTWGKPRKRVTKATTRTESKDSDSETAETDNWWERPFGTVQPTKTLRSSSWQKKVIRGTIDGTPQTQSDMTSVQALRLAVDKTRWKSSGSRGAPKWAKPITKTSPVITKDKTKSVSVDSSVDGMSDDSAEWFDGGKMRGKALRRFGRRRFVQNDGFGRNDPTKPRVAGALVWRSPTTKKSQKEQSQKDSEETRTADVTTPAIPSDSVTRRRAPCIAFKPRRSAVISFRGKQTKASKTFAEVSRVRVSSKALDFLEKSLAAFGSQIEEMKHESQTPGPGSYDVSPDATRPSVCSTPKFREFRPVDVRTPIKQDKVHTPDEVQIDLSAEKFRLASGVKNTFPGVSFEKALPRVTYFQEMYDKASLQEQIKSSGELITREFAKRKVAAYEFGDEDFIDDLSLKIARGEIVAPRVITREAVEPRVVGGAWGKYKSLRSSGGALDFVRVEDDVSSTLLAARHRYAKDSDVPASFAATKKRVTVSSFGAAPTTPLYEKDVDEAIARGPSTTHAPPDTLARGKALGGGVLPLRYYLARDEDYVSRVKKRQEEEAAAKELKFETGKLGVGGAPVVASLRVAEALDALRTATPATVFGLAAERWAARDRLERDSEQERVRKLKAKKPYLAGRAARLLDTFDTQKETPSQTASRIARLTEQQYNDSGGAQWLGQEALWLIDQATRPSAPGWRILPLEVTKARVAVGRPVNPGARPALDVKIHLVRTKGFLEGGGAVDFGKSTGRNDGISGKKDQPEENRRVGPSSYKPEKSEAKVLRKKAPSAVFGTASRLPVVKSESFSPAKRSDELVRVSLDRAIRRRKSTSVDMRRTFNPRTYPEILKVQAESRKASALSKLDKLAGSGVANDRIGHAKFISPVADLYAVTDAHAPATDFASMTWRVTENSKGKVELSLLEAEVGPGRYDVAVDSLAGKRRTPVVDFASAKDRFPEKQVEEQSTAQSQYAAASDVRAAAARVRPRVAIGGVIGRHGVSTGKQSTKPETHSLPPSAVVNLEDALSYLRSSRYSSALDFGKQTDRASGVGKETAEDARLFADISASTFASASGAKGTQSSIHSFGVPPVVPSKAEHSSASFTEGDVLYLTPETADASTRRRGFEQLAFAKTVGRNVASGLVPDVELTRDIDFVSETVLKKRFPRLDKGSNAVDLGKARDTTGGGFGGNDEFFASGTYADSQNVVDQKSLRSGRRRAPVFAFPKSERRNDVNPYREGGDALVLRPEVALDSVRPRRDGKSVSFAKGSSRNFSNPKEKDAALHQGDSLLLDPVYPATVGTDLIGQRRAHYFGRSVGRYTDPYRRGWGEAEVIHALRSDYLISENKLDRTAAAKDGYAVAAARRVERRNRLEARMARRGPGEDAPSRERRDGPVR